MIVDLILDRKDDNIVWSDTQGYIPYNSHSFYLAVMNYGEIGYNITKAMDEGTEEDVKNALCKYIKDGEYNPSICDYIRSVTWLDD